MPFSKFNTLKTSPSRRTPASVAPTEPRPPVSSVLSRLAGMVFSFYIAADHSLSAVADELDTIAAFVIGGTLLTGGAGSVIGTFLGILIQDLIQTYITFDGTLSSWWTKIVTGVLLFAFIALQQAMKALARRSAASRAGAKAMTSRIVVIPTRCAPSNHAEVARSIGVDIIASRYGEGVRLPGDAELTGMFSVSRPVLRASVRTLVAKALLSTKARAGTVVREHGAWNMFDADVLAWHIDAGIDKRFLGDLAEVRLAVEPHAAALAAARRPDADILDLQRSMDQMQQEASDSIGNVTEAALRASFLLSAPVDPEDRETALLWHQRIVDGIASGDGEAATRAMVDVIHNGMRRHERSADVQATTVVTTDESDNKP